MKILHLLLLGSEAKRNWAKWEKDELVLIPGGSVEKGAESTSNKCTLENLPEAENAQWQCKRKETRKGMEIKSGTTCRLQCNKLHELVNAKGEEYTMGHKMVKCKAGKKWLAKPKKANCVYMPDGFHAPLGTLG